MEYYVLIIIGQNPFQCVQCFYIVGLTKNTNKVKVRIQSHNF